MEKQLPKNWVEIELNSLCNIQSGGTPSRGIAEYWNGTIPWVKISDINSFYVNVTEEYITEEGLKNSSAKMFAKGTILFTIFATIGKISILNIDATTNQAIVGITQNKYIHKHFLIYALQNKVDEIILQGKGVAQNNINMSILKESIIPLPPLTEQERIAEKLDALFGQLDSVRGAMNRIPTLLANLRQQILTHAVTGKLTAHKGNIHILANHLQSIKYGTSKKSDYDISDGIPVLRIPNIKDGKIDITDLKYSLFDPKEYQLLRLSKGDVLVIRSNGSISLVGQSAIVDNNCDGFCYAGYLIRLRFNNDILPDFINYSFRSEFVRKQIVDLAHSTSGVNNINAQQIQNLSFVYFEKPGQEEIVNRVQSLFEKLDSIEQRYQMLKTKLENLPQAILHKAFKGELVEQLPSDGNATDILREIEQLKKSLKKK